MKWTGGSGDFQQPPVGTHLARCIGIIDLGTQKSEYQGQANIRRQVILRWELPEALMDDGRPFVASKFYTASLNEKAKLYADLVNWRGREFTQEELAGFDSKNVLDKTCMVSITLSDSGKARVTGLMRAHAKAQIPPRHNPLVFFSLEPGEYQQDIFDSLPEGFQRIIRMSPEYQALHSSSGTPTADGVDTDDIPFILNECVYDVRSKFERRMQRASK